MLKDVEMTEQPLSNKLQDRSDGGDKGKDKEKFNMLTSHDDGYTEPIYNTSDVDESILDDEEEWRGEEGDADSILGDQDDGDEDGDEDEACSEMVIERPFGEPQAALLDLAHANTPLEETSQTNLEPISLKNILPPGSRRTRPTTFN